MTAVPPPFGYDGGIDYFDVVMVRFSVYDDVPEGITVDHDITYEACLMNSNLSPFHLNLRPLIALTYASWIAGVSVYNDGNALLYVPI